LERLFAAGINFRNAGVEERSAFSLSAEQQEELLQLAKEAGMNELIVLCTCNRTEFYGLGSAGLAISLFAQVSGHSLRDLEAYLFEKKGPEALSYIFEVASGLNSQILGDFEILGQFRQAAFRSAEMGLLGPFFHRLTNTAIQASKRVKSRTRLSRGTVSASYAAMEFLRQRYAYESADILLVGAGKFGRTIAKNLCAYLPQARVRIFNRTDARAEELARSLQYDWSPFENLRLEARKARVVISCARADRYLLSLPDLAGAATEMILDLSIPSSIDPSVKDLPGIQLLDIDRISALLDHTLEQRRQEIPAARRILIEHQEAFTEWAYIFDRSHVIRRVKKRLMAISSQCPYLSNLDDELLKKKMNKAISRLVRDLRARPDHEVREEAIIQFFMESNHPVAVPSPNH
jgi:glutamyl-tRNA reductase